MWFYECYFIKLFGFYQALLQTDTSPLPGPLRQTFLLKMHLAFTSSLAISSPGTAILKERSEGSRRRLLCKPVVSAVPGEVALRKEAAFFSAQSFYPLLLLCWQSWDWCFECLIFLPTDCISLAMNKCEFINVWERNLFLHVPVVFHSWKS